MEIVPPVLGIDILKYPNKGSLLRSHPYLQRASAMPARIPVNPGAPGVAVGGSPARNTDRWRVCPDVTLIVFVTDGYPSLRNSRECGPGVISVKVAGMLPV